jgi:alkaline phosphatase D
MKRREFIKTPGYFVAAAALGGVAACGDDNSSADAGPELAYSFAEGVASGDPRETSVVLWTRVQDSAGSMGPITVTAEVSQTADFATLLIEQQLTVDASSDHTLRLLVTDLEAGSVYYYRFRVGETTSTVGRTLTAPPATDTAPVRLAWVSCQDYATGTYGAYRALMNDDDAQPEDQRIQFIVHLGDFIYETVGQGFQGAIDENLQPIEITNRDGSPRRVEQFPSGGGQVDGASFAQTVDDYRHLYKQFLRDPDLQAARARWPFIHTWDDHEFTNDSWQTQANYVIGTSLDEPSQTRKVACHQAWFEFVPSNLSDAEGVPGVASRAADFTPTQVTDTPYSEADVDADNLITEANNLAALASMTIYRSFRYGQNIELVVTDTRSYRSDHPIPEELTQNAVFFDPRNAVPKDMTDIFDAGMTANNGSPPDTVGGIPNPRTQSPPGAMLGVDQKAWFKDTLAQSTATWKVWANSAPLMRLVARNDPPDVLLVDRVVSSDAWDGYHTERTEIGTFIRDNNIQNLVVLTGDIHAHFAGQVMDDFNAVQPQPIGAEFVAAGISSNSMFSFYEDAARALEPSLRGLVTYDSQPFGGQDPLVNNLNVLLLHGAGAARAAEGSHDLAAIEAASDPLANPHLKFTDTNAQGYGVMTVTTDGITASLVTVIRPIVDNPEGPGVKYSVTFTMAKDDPSSLSDPVFEGTPPFPFPGSV